ncbi:unnamed protein product [Camellia sinensis]
MKTLSLFFFLFSVVPFLGDLPDERSSATPATRLNKRCSPTLATIKVERSFYNPGDPTSATSTTRRPVRLPTGLASLDSLCFLDRSVMSTSSVNGSTSDQLTYCNRNCPQCWKKVIILISETERNKNKLFYCYLDCSGFIAWCLPTNSQPREEGQVRMENTPTITEQLQSMGEHLRFQSEQHQFQNAQMQKLQRDIIEIRVVLMGSSSCL